MNISNFNKFPIMQLHWSVCSFWDRFAQPELSHRSAVRSQTTHKYMKMWNLTWKILNLSWLEWVNSSSQLYPKPKFYSPFQTQAFFTQQCISFSLKAWWLLLVHISHWMPTWTEKLDLSSGSESRMSTNGFPPRLSTSMNLGGWMPSRAVFTPWTSTPNPEGFFDTEVQLWHQYLNKCSKHLEAPPTPYSLQDGNLDDSRLQNKHGRTAGRTKKCFKMALGLLGEWCFMYTWNWLQFQNSILLTKGIPATVDLTNVLVSTHCFTRSQLVICPDFVPQISNTLWGTRSKTPKSNSYRWTHRFGFDGRHPAPVDR